MPIPSQVETAWQFMERLETETATAYKASPFKALSSDYFARFSRDPDARPGPAEVQIDSTWTIGLPDDLSPLGKGMAIDLADFMKCGMGVALKETVLPRAQALAGPAKTIVLLDQGGGDAAIAESFSILVTNTHVTVSGRDPAGLRDGVVRLVDQMGFRQAPIVGLGAQVYTPRMSVRLGPIPRMGSARETVFLGYNAVYLGNVPLWQISTSDAIPELASRRRPDVLEKLVQEGRKAGAYGLRSYVHLGTQQRFKKTDPIFGKYPDIRGASRGGDDILCTEHPLVKKFLSESVANLFRQIPELSGVSIIVGGEGFYHCFMNTDRSCARCNALGANVVVANLCNTLAAAAREVNPAAEVLAWPYSAVHAWSQGDPNQAGFIANLKPGTGILTEVEKDEIVVKPEGVNKLLWDYSIDMVGLGARAQGQRDACRKAGIPIYFKSEPEMSFEAPRVPFLPCLDRWAERAEAVTASGAAGLFNFSASRMSVYASSSVEGYKFAFWNPAPNLEESLQKLAARIAGPEAGPHLRQAWKAVSEAIAFTPEIGPYYQGPAYLGPAHPLCADPAAPLPEVFKGRYLYLAELNDAEGLAKRPTYLTSASGNAPVFGRMYREMEKCLKTAADEVNAAAPGVPDRCALMFRSERSAILWFYATARTLANFYESCALRDRFAALAAGDKAELLGVYDRWLAVLKDERQNAAEALPLAEADMRLDCYYGGDHCFSHMADLVRAKRTLIDDEIDRYLPSLRAALK